MRKISNLESKLITMKEEQKYQQQCHAYIVTSREHKIRKMELKSFLL
jgi:hypothetical protein